MQGEKLRMPLDKDGKFYLCQFYADNPKAIAPSPNTKPNALLSQVLRVVLGSHPIKKPSEK
jgi:hypothetical protein